MITIFIKLFLLILFTMFTLACVLSVSYLRVSQRVGFAALLILTAVVGVFGLFDWYYGTNVVLQSVVVSIPPIPFFSKFVLEICWDVYLGFYWSVALLALFLGIRFCEEKWSFAGKSIDLGRWIPCIGLGLTMVSVVVSCFFYDSAFQLYQTNPLGTAQGSGLIILCSVVGIFLVMQYYGYCLMRHHLTYIFSIVVRFLADNRLCARGIKYIILQILRWRYKGFFGSIIVTWIARYLLSSPIRADGELKGDHGLSDIDRAALEFFTIDPWNVTNKSRKVAADEESDYERRYWYSWLIDAQLKSFKVDIYPSPRPPYVLIPAIQEELDRINNLASKAYAQSPEGKALGKKIRERFARESRRIHDLGLKRKPGISVTQAELKARRKWLDKWKKSFGEPLFEGIEFTKKEYEKLGTDAWVVSPYYYYPGAGPYVYLRTTRFAGCSVYLICTFFILDILIKRLWRKCYRTEREAHLLLLAAVTIFILQVPVWIRFIGEFPFIYFPDNYHLGWFVLTTGAIIVYNIIDALTDLLLSYMEAKNRRL